MYRRLRKRWRARGGLTLCSFYHESLRTLIKTIVNKFVISNYTALILGVHALRSYLKLIREYELHSLPNKNVSGAKDHGKNYINVRPALDRHLLHKRLFLQSCNTHIETLSCTINSHIGYQR